MNLKTKFSIIGDPMKKWKKSIFVFWKCENPLFGREAYGTLSDFKIVSEMIWGFYDMLWVALGYFEAFESNVS